MKPKILVEDGTTIRLTWVPNPRTYGGESPLYKEITAEMSRCSSTEDACNLHEHPDVIECCVHETFRCNRCQQIHSWEFGAADDAPGLCDDCWAVFFAEASHAAEPMEVI